jgi:hypothetical protein
MRIAVPFFLIFHLQFSSNNNSFILIETIHVSLTLTHTHTCYWYILLQINNFIRKQNQREQKFKNDDMRKISKLEPNLKQRLVQYFHDTSVGGKQTFLWRRGKQTYKRMKSNAVFLLTAMAFPSSFT